MISNQYRNSFFVDTIVSWNKLPEDTARAHSRSATNLAALSPMGLYTSDGPASYLFRFRFRYFKM